MPSFPLILHHVNMLRLEVYKGVIPLLIINILAKWVCQIPRSTFGAMSSQRTHKHNEHNYTFRVSDRTEEEEEDTFRVFKTVTLRDYSRDKNCIKHRPKNTRNDSCIITEKGTHLCHDHKQANSTKMYY